MVTRSFLVLAVLAMTAPARAAVPTIEPAQRHFDHDRHNAEMQKNGNPVPACAACHAIDDKTKLDWKIKSGWGAKLSAGEHNRCFGACHGKDGDHDYHPECGSLAGPHSPAKLCAVCHPVKPKCRPADMPAAQSTDPSFAAKFTHSRHLSIGTSIERDCAYCHKAESAGQPPLTVRPHVMCGGCHNANGAKPPITDCASCHQKPKPPSKQAADPYRLRPFDHPTHASASKQASCTGCHDKLVGATNEEALPRPTMLNCQTKCHDGQKSFAATGTKCTQCHRSSSGGSDKPPQLRQDLGFNHAEHEKRQVNINDCAACHSSAADGTLAPPGDRRDHMPCAKSGCHQTEFLARNPKICGICHETAAPWQKNVSRPGKMLAEWFQTMNHASHVKAAGGSGNATCQQCHGEKLTGGNIPRNHAACARCHGKGQAPAMTDCAACHNRTKPSHPPPSQWSVSANFKHTTHATDPRTKRTTNCVECHATVPGSKDLASITAPKMSQCDTCHDGKTSFKSTGFGCARCHGPAPEKPPPSAALMLLNATAMR